MSQAFQLLMWNRNCERCVYFGGGKRCVTCVSQVVIGAWQNSVRERHLYEIALSHKRIPLHVAVQYLPSPAYRLNITHNLLGVPQLDFNIVSCMLPNMI